MNPKPVIVLPQAETDIEALAAFLNDKKVHELAPVTAANPAWLARLKALAPGLTPRTALEKLAGLQMVDVYLPTTDGRQLLLRRYTEPDADQRLLLAQLKLQLPKQPPPKIAVSLPVKPLSPSVV